MILKQCWLGMGISGGCILLSIYLSPPTVNAQNKKCDKSYPNICIPSPPPDLDCKDISYRNFRVLQPDPHRFDGDKDGIGCEKR